MNDSAATVVLLGDYDYEYFREVSLRDGLGSQGVRVRECRYREQPLFIGVRKLLLLPYFYAVIAWRLRRIAKEETAVDAIVVTKFNVLVLPMAAVAAWWLDALLVYDLFVSLSRTGQMRDFSTWKVRLVYLIEWVALRLPDYHLTETSEFARLYADLYALPEDRIIGVPIGADNDAFHPSHARPTDTFTVVYWGNFLPHHGLDTVVDAIERLSGADIEFHFYGEGPEQERIAKRAASAALDRVTFHGRVPMSELSVAAASADVALGIFSAHPRARASITNKVTEGVAAGTAVVTRDSPAIREWFTDGETICTVPAENPDGLADAIQTLRDDPALADRLGRAGRERYEAVFSVEHIGAMLVEDLPLDQ